MYYREFQSQDEVCYRVEILTMDSSKVAKEVQLPADSPVVIEWPEVEKLEPVQGSRLELKLLSESDREFVDLYTVKVGSVRCDVYRDGELYWSGTLVTEFYEEPYATKEGYEVSLTFSDFAPLERMKWQARGVMTLKDIIGKCVGASGIKYVIPIVQHISTQHSDSTVFRIDRLYLSCENFYDEDGEPMTIKEVLEGVLRPWGMSIVQKSGRVIVYDLHSLSGQETEEVSWDSSDQMMGVDKTYNDVTVTFSPYAETTIIDGSLDDDAVLNTDVMVQYYTNYNRDIEGFRITNGEGERTDLPLALSNGAEFFRIASDYSGSDEVGVAWQYKGENGAYHDTYMVGSATQGFGKVMMNGKVYDGTGTDEKVAIMRSGKGFLVDVGTIDREKYRLRIDLSLLADVRYNPFEEAKANLNEAGNWDRMQNWCNYAYIPVMLRLYDGAGSVLCHYENNAVMESGSYKQDGAGWVAGDGKWGCMWLAYYDWSDRKSKSGLGGWQQNKQIIGHYSGGLPDSWKKRGDGEYIELPPMGGWLELTIGKGLHQFDNDDRKEHDIQSRMRWLLYKNPKIAVVKKNGLALELEDLEEVAWIDSAAEDNMTIDTIIGTPGDSGRSVPSARGMIMNSSLKAYTKFSRGGVTARLERLLIGTVCSQYAGRHIMLTGTAKLVPKFALMSDASTSGKFLIVQETQDLYEGTSELKMVEVSPDDYQGIEYK